jgi:hypothetical protein
MVVTMRVGLGSSLAGFAVCFGSRMAITGSTVMATGSFFLGGRLYR